MSWFATHVVRCRFRASVALILLALALTAMLGTDIAVARAGEAGPGWTITALAQPTNFSSGENAECERYEGDPTACDSYVLDITNAGTGGYSGSPLVIRDKVPVPVHAVYVTAQDMETGHVVKCGPTLPAVEPGSEEPEVAEIVCVDEQPVPAGDALTVEVVVTVSGNKTYPSVTNEAALEQTAPGSKISAAEINDDKIGASTTILARTSAPTSMSNSVNDEAPLFEPATFTAQAFGADGTPDTTAGDHHGMVATTLDYTSVNRGADSGDFPVQEPKTVIIDLPVGFVGDPLAAGTCPEADLREGGPGCPADSQVGAVILNEKGALSDSEVGAAAAASDLYNMVPEPGYPLEFAFNVAKEGEILLYPRVIPTDSGYALSIASPALPRSGVTPAGFTLMFFGDPPLRDAELSARQHGAPQELVSPTALFTNPTSCGTGPQLASVEVDSWVQPSRWTTRTDSMYEAAPGEGLDECNALQLNTQLEVKPEQSTVDTPSGYTVDVKVPQPPDLSPDLSSPDLRSVEVQLPEGAAISPASGQGLIACHSQGPEGINITHDWTPTGAQPLDPEDPEAMEIGADGLPHVAPGHCPPASKVGTVEITTPLLSEPLTGNIYIGEPECGEAAQPACSSELVEQGKLFKLYLEAAQSGILLKLEGRISANATTGRLTVTFGNTPQLPFSDLKFMMDGGTRAPLVNPQGCATAEATGLLAPWSEPTMRLGDAHAGAYLRTSSFSLSGCGSQEPFTPEFLGETTDPSAGASSPLVLTLTRHDGEQDLSGFTVSTPPGLLGVVADVEPCHEPRIAQNSCENSSEVGHTLVAVGAGANPAWESGTVYLTEGYEGAPFGLSIVTPARVGPFNLGNVVVRAAIHIDPQTAALTITSRPMPQIVDGVPLRIQTVYIALDRPGFILNPTSCSQHAITASITGALPSGEQGSQVTLSTPFAASDCKSLPFAPHITAQTHAQTSKANGAYLQVDILNPLGDDNVGKLKIDLPKALPSRLSTLQKACTVAVFEANPLHCPAASVVGSATAYTAIFTAPLTGPAYMVSHGGSAFPDLEMVLQGEGVTLNLIGVTDISGGITSEAFRALPDTPISRFELTLPEQPYSALAANTNLCKANLATPVELTGQDGAVVKQTTKVAVSGCPKAKAKKKKKKKKHVKAKHKAKTKKA
jgi:hypothetical protein